MTLGILISLKTMESLKNGLQPHSGVTPLFSMRTVSLASLQSCRSNDIDAWCKRALTVTLTFSLGETGPELLLIFGKSSVCVGNFNVLTCRHISEGDWGQGDPSGSLSRGE